MKNTILNKENVEKFLSSCNEDSKVYLGCDSKRFRDNNNQWFADYMLCIVIHVNGNNGAKIFGRVETEKLYDKDPSKPSLRLMNEVVKVSQLFLEYEDILTGYDVEIHLDLNKQEMFASNNVMQEALGYIRGVCQMEAKSKPEAWAASTAADRFKSLK